MIEADSKKRKRGTDEVPDAQPLPGEGKEEKNGSSAPGEPENQPPSAAQIACKKIRLDQTADIFALFEVRVLQLLRFIACYCCHMSKMSGPVCYCADPVRLPFRLAIPDATFFENDRSQPARGRLSCLLLTFARIGSLIIHATCTIGRAASTAR